MTDEPESPSDPRPNGEPYYIGTTCEECGSDLVLYDDVYDTGGSVWHDEWVCPTEDCQTGIYLDWPEEEFDGLVERVTEPIEATPLDEVENRVFDDE